MFRWRAVLPVLMLSLAPSAAQADWLFTPSLGGTFGGDTFNRERLTYGAAVSWLDEEAFGWEAEFSYSPDFFEGENDLFTFDGSGSVISLMGNAVVGAPVGGPDGRFRPYVTGGVGLMQMRVVSDAGAFETLTHEVGFNLGAGLIGFASDYVGLRGDVRYLRSFQDQVPSWTRGTDIDVAPGHFDFWRASVGVTLRFPDR
jgi:hypothetical protein